MIRMHDFGKRCVDVRVVCALLLTVAGCTVPLAGVLGCTIADQWSDSVDATEYLSIAGTVHQQVLSSVASGYWVTDDDPVLVPVAPAPVVEPALDGGSAVEDTCPDAHSVAPAAAVAECVVAPPKPAAAAARPPPAATVKVAVPEPVKAEPVTTEPVKGVSK